MCIIRRQVQRHAILQTLFSTKTFHAATDVYESTDDYDQITFVRDANQHHWLRDYKTLAMTQRDLNYLTKWVDDVKLLTRSGTMVENMKVPRLS